MAQKLNYRFKTEPYQHQLDALSASYKEKVFALFCEMGTGKSKILLDNIAMLFDEGKLNGTESLRQKVFTKTDSTRDTNTFTDHIQCRTFNGLLRHHEPRRSGIVDQLYQDTRDPSLTLFVMNIKRSLLNLDLKKPLNFYPHIVR